MHLLSVAIISASKGCLCFIVMNPECCIVSRRHVRCVILSQPTDTMEWMDGWIRRISVIRRRPQLGTAPIMTDCLSFLNRFRFSTACYQTFYCIRVFSPLSICLPVSLPLVISMIVLSAAPGAWPTGIRTLGKGGGDRPHRRRRRGVRLSQNTPPPTPRPQRSRKLRLSVQPIRAFKQR